MNQRLPHSSRTRLATLRLVRGFHRAYKRCLSPFFGNACRFYPFCSDYMVAAIEKHGLLKGSWLGVKRLCKCHPFNPGGFDPVP